MKRKWIEVARFNRTRKGILLVAALLLTVVGAGVYWFDAGQEIALRIAVTLGLYEEPEHELVAVRDEEGNILYWTCSMHPWVRADEAGKCPICGMDLVPVLQESTDRSEVPPAGGHGAHGVSPPAPQTAAMVDSSGGPGSQFNISLDRQQLIGVRFTEARRRPLTKIIRTVGRVELDERGIAQIHTKVSGWIEQIFVDFTWQHVNQGDPLFAIYSPELVSAQEEYLLALKARDQLAHTANPFPRAASYAQTLVEAARARLDFWDVTAAQVEELERTRTAKRTLTIYSPISGHVMERNAFPQTRVLPEMNLYTIADHSSVWVYVDIYENEISLIRTGQKAEITVPAYPNEVFRGLITYIDPHLNLEARTLRVRLEFPNPDLRLKPGMYADFRLEIGLGTRLTIPKDTVLRTGQQDLVFIDRGAGQMEVRSVHLGMEIEDAYEVISGLRSGDRVVSAANFLVDAESQVQGAIAAWQPREQPTSTGTQPSPATSEPAGVTAEIVEPKQARVGTNTVQILVKDATGSPVPDADVEITLFMPAMGSMAPISVSASLRPIGQGQYSGAIDIPTAFSWQTTITIKKGGQLTGTVRTTLLAR
ncbi:MAG: hypothetical protein A3F68_04715 [Acidobacteria bacterium RIFCSPLOWO2_12_FULL_54_10]|nr:MAG: hypothetical protein A3F68_04715 [Acidobacteria bacterium RIFCSPLOWO2_12_FULL_54_10]